MNKSLYFLSILEDDSKFKSLSAEKKFNLIIDLVKRHTIKDYEGLVKSLSLMGWTTKEFLNTFKLLWDNKKIGWEELDLLDTNDHVFKGPGFIGDRWLISNIGDKELCDRIPSKHWGDLPYCKRYKDSLA